MPVRNKKFGLVLPQWVGAMGGDTARGSDLIGQARLCEDLGFDSLWTADQILFDLGEYTSVVGSTPGDNPSGSKRGYWECWAIIGALASATSRIELGTLVSCTAYRNPALLARMADTVDELSNGRLVLGLGAGALKSEFESFGFEWEHRISRFDEALQIITPLLKGESSTFEGKFYRTKQAQLVPKGLRPNGPPILIGTVKGGPKMRRLMAKYADQWNCWLAENSQLSAYQEAYDLIVRSCEEFGRNPATLTKNVCVNVCLEGWPPNPGEIVLSGSNTEIAEQLDHFLSADIDHLVAQLFPNTPHGIETLSEILSELG